MYSERFEEQPKFREEDRSIDLNTPGFKRAQQAMETKFLTSERPLDSKDVENFANEIKREVHGIITSTDSSEKRASLIKDALSVENLLAKLESNGYKIESTNMGDKSHESDDVLVTKVSWFDAGGNKQEGFFSNEDLEVVLHPLRKAVLEKIVDDLETPIILKEQDRFKELTSPRTINAAEEFETKFLTSENALNSEDIEKFAKAIKLEIKIATSVTSDPEEQASLIIYLLKPESLMEKLLGGSGYENDGSDDATENYDPVRGVITHLAWTDEKGESQYGSFDQTDWEDALYQLRKVVLDKLTEDVDPKTVHLVTRALTDNKRILELRDNKILKLAKDHNKISFLEPEEKSGRMEALKELYSLPERSPYIAYVVLEVENNFEPYQGREIQQKMEMKTLEDLLKEKDSVEFKKMLGYVLQGMKGANFLVKKNLRLTDFVPKNIGVDVQKDKAFLFDFDGLKKKDVAVEWYPAHSGYVPPEREKKKNKAYAPEDERIFLAGGVEIDRNTKKPIEESEMVYELGCLLETVRGAYGASLKQADLFASMKDLDPEKRPKLEEVVVALEKEIDELQTN
jgi:hypothetical protein